MLGIKLNLADIIVLINGRVLLQYLSEGDRVIIPGKPR